jgi:hypothetical protein
MKVLAAPATRSPRRLASTSARDLLAPRTVLAGVLPGPGRGLERGEIDEEAHVSVPSSEWRSTGMWSGSLVRWTERTPPSAPATSSRGPASRDPRGAVGGWSRLPTEVHEQVAQASERRDRAFVAEVGVAGRGDPAAYLRMVLAPPVVHPCRRFVPEALAHGRHTRVGVLLDRAALRQGRPGSLVERLDGREQHDVTSGVPFAKDPHHRVCGHYLVGVHGKESDR